MEQGCKRKKKQAEFMCGILNDKISDTVSYMDNTSYIDFNKLDILISSFFIACQ